MCQCDELPSRFQLGDEVMCFNEKGTVNGVSFMLVEDGLAKIAYDIVTRNGLQSRVLSEDVSIARPRPTLIVVSNEV